MKRTEQIIEFKRDGSVSLGYEPLIITSSSINRPISEMLNCEYDKKGVLVVKKKNANFNS